MTKTKENTKALLERKKDELLAEAIEVVKKAGITPGNIDPNLIINKRAKSRLGLCRKLANKEYGYEIELTESTLRYGKEVVMNTLIHEVLHTVEGCMNHGPIWTRYANKINRMFGYKIEVETYLEDFEDVESAKYLIQCTNEKCGTLFIRHRKGKLVNNPEHYLCQCGGKLKRIR